jgi:hypothetical protein
MKTKEESLQELRSQIKIIQDVYIKKVQEINENGTDLETVVVAQNNLMEETPLKEAKIYEKIKRLKNSD